MYTEEDSLRSQRTFLEGQLYHEQTRQRDLEWQKQQLEDKNRQAKNDIAAAEASASSAQRKTEEVQISRKSMSHYAVIGAYRGMLLWDKLKTVLSAEDFKNLKSEINDKTKKVANIEHFDYNTKSVLHNWEKRYQNKRDYLEIDYGGTNVFQRTINVLVNEFHFFNYFAISFIEKNKTSLSKSAIDKINTKSPQSFFAFFESEANDFEVTFGVIGLNHYFNIFKGSILGQATRNHLYSLNDIFASKNFYDHTYAIHTVRLMVLNYVICNFLEQEKKNLNFKNVGELYDGFKKTVRAEELVEEETQKQKFLQNKFHYHFMNKDVYLDVLCANYNRLDGLRNLVQWRHERNTQSESYASKPKYKKYLTEKTLQAFIEYAAHTLQEKYQGMSGFKKYIEGLLVSEYEKKTSSQEVINALKSVYVNKIHQLNIQVLAKTQELMKALELLEEESVKDKHIKSTQKLIGEELEKSLKERMMGDYMGRNIQPLIMNELEKELQFLALLTPFRATLDFYTDYFKDYQSTTLLKNYNKPKAFNSSWFGL